MRILVMGGTGAIGRPLVNILAEQGHEVWVTTRKYRKSENTGIRYIQGDAHDIEFMSGVLQEKPDAIVDFMVYTTAQFKERADLYLSSTSQYFFISSSRVYSNSDFTPIEENTIRLLDSEIEDEAYKKTDEYALAKARQEDILHQSEKKNYVIIRPYITYNNDRLQLGTLEKDLWLPRAIEGKSIVFSRDVAQKITTMTYAYDVALRLSMLIGSKDVLGESIHITTNEYMTWENILEIYLETIEKETKRRPKIYWFDTYDEIARIVKNRPQNKYDRMYNRIFNNAKIEDICRMQNLEGYMSIEDGLKKCLSDGLRKQDLYNRPWRVEGNFDRITGEKTKCKDIPGWKNKIRYFLGYYLKV